MRCASFQPFCRGFVGILAGGLDLDPADLNIAGGGSRNDPAVAFDLSDQPARTDKCADQRQRDSQRQRQPDDELSGRAGAPVARV